MSGLDDVARAPGGIRFVLVGGYQVITDVANPDKVVVRDNRSGEALQCEVAKLEAKLREFFGEEF